MVSRDEGVTIRMPRELHTELLREQGRIMAEKGERVSMWDIIRRALEHKQAFDRMGDAVRESGILARPEPERTP